MHCHIIQCLRTSIQDFLILHSEIARDGHLPVKVASRYRQRPMYEVAKRRDQHIVVCSEKAFPREV